ncbi:ethanolamine ammonia-lyase reactivating factor EutA [Clostridium akagii]|uniref:ethanolamine ammonia-lyase reactivating factor EutA n=1 Tax=Clostridium akagii TaxID=91623 RepID=UPI00068A36D0|nr:ethanolamine ammonia-lyase reactivating factor EutA [Clostridium akagii]
MLSVGIDIGTTTLQLIFSEITVCNVSGSFSMPQIKIKSKKIIYKSEIYFTPLTDFGNIDLHCIKKIISCEYINAGINKQDIATGAIIITGETAIKKNAEQVLNALSEFAGDFVVATAGGDLEAILAGFGSGSSDISKEKSLEIMNFDVGGGTTNVAVFKDGEIMDSFALHIGGRLIKIDKDYKITYISEKIEKLMVKLGLHLNVGVIAGFNQLKQFTDVLAKILIKIGLDETLDEESKGLFIAHGTSHLRPEAFTFSGGVSEFIYKKLKSKDMNAVTEYGDIGPLLGYSIREEFDKGKLEILESKEKIRATVIGAGSFSMEISGSTIFFDHESLPIKNIPILKLKNGENGIVEDNIMSKVKMYQDSNIALAFEGEKSPSYAKVKSIAEAIVQGLKERNDPIIIIIENDFAKALGQTIKNMLDNSKKVICIDQIKVENGDYVDIGRPICGVLPVVIKTLIFKN